MNPSSAEFCNNAHYHWHALFGRQLRVERVDRRKSGQFVGSI
ncbi:hypothetical protein [Paracoccus marinaquae]|nr:hypothetical protein [Paracoccus marinaquae]